VSSGRPCPRHFSVRAWPWAIVFRGGPASQRAERSGARSDQSGDAGAVESPRVPPLNRFWILAGALAVTIGALALAFWLGSASFDVRRYGQHNGRLAKVMLERPSADRLTRGLAAEGTPLLITAVTAEDKDRAAVARGGARLAEIREKAPRHPELRVYQAGDMLYFIFFDAEGVMRDFTCVSR